MRFYTLEQINCGVPFRNYRIYRSVCRIENGNTLSPRGFSLNAHSEEKDPILYVSLGPAISLVSLNFFGGRAAGFMGNLTSKPGFSPDVFMSASGRVKKREPSFSIPFSLSQ